AGTEAVPEDRLSITPNGAGHCRYEEIAAFMQRDLRVVGLPSAAEISRPGALALTGGRAFAAAGRRFSSRILRWLSCLHIH
ncbi:MAG: hypothetical protein ABR578_13870, partial [Chromatocurvus sp.]